MTEGPFQPLTLVPHEVEALDRLLGWVEALPLDQRIIVVSAALDERAVLTAAVERAAPGSMQSQPGLPVHAARALAQVPIGGTLHPIAQPVCDVDALGVVTADRTLVDCDLCLALVADMQTPCPNQCNDGYVERAATPEEVDAGHELGVAFDPCPLCNPQPVDDATAVLDGRDDLTEAMRSSVHEAAAAHGMTVVDLDASVGTPIVDRLDQPS